MIERALRQFSRPTGRPGRVAGRLMARMNGPLHDWVVGLLDIRPTDRVLEVGYGPGLGVERSSALAPEGHVAGIDVSEVMWRQARRRNRWAIREGRVDLRVGEASALPFPDQSFQHALSINSLRFWPSAERGLSEILRTLRPGGRFALALRMRREDVGRYDRSRFGMTDSDLEELQALLGTIGFRDLRVKRREIRSEHMAALLTQRGT